MTTLTIYNVPDNDKEFITEVVKLVKRQGYDMRITDDGDNLSIEELRSLVEALKEVGEIKKGRLNPIPASDLWK